MNRLFVSARHYHRWLAPTLKALKGKKDKLPVRAPDPRKSFVEWNYDAELYAFGKRLGEELDRNLLRIALTEPSYLKQEENKQRDVGIEPDIKLTSNEELVAIGHRLIENYLLRYLTESLPKLPGPYILNIKNYLMSNDILAHVSKNIGIDDIILVPEDFPNSESLVRGLKAVVGSLQDVPKAERLIRDLILSQLCGFDLTKLTTPDNPVSDLENTFSETNRTPPEYRLIAESGVNTLLPVYHVGVYCDRIFVGRGVGESVSVAKDMAACDALWRLWAISRRKPFKMDLDPPKMVIPFSTNTASSSVHM